jgi:hypothetical protein
LSDQVPGNLYVSKDAQGRAVLTYPTYGCQCDHSCVYRSATPQNLIDPQNDASSNGTFAGEQWTEEVPLSGTISFYARSTVIENPHGGIIRKWGAATPGSPTTAVSDSAHVYLGAGAAVIALDSVDGHSLGSAALGSAVTRAPALGRLDQDGMTYVFAVTQSGFLWRLLAPTLSPSGSISLRRAGCGADEVTSPVLQLRAQSNSAFRTTVNEDLVLVATRHGCGDSTGNQVRALLARDLSAPAAWIFNGGEYEVDFFAGCSLDYGSNTLFCGANRPSSTFQSTLWAISTLDGSLKWAVDAGALHSRPFFNPGVNNHVFVVDIGGTLRAFNAATGAQDWQLHLGGSTLTVEIDVVGSSTAPYADLLFATDADGVLHTVHDGGTTTDAGTELWASSFGGVLKAVDAPTIAPSLGKPYVPLNNVSVHQLDISMGLDEANRVLNCGTNARVPTPVLGLPGSDPVWLVASENTATCGASTAKYCIPWGIGSTGS